jgi:hypothetical protein
MTGSPARRPEISQVRLWIAMKIDWKQEEGTFVGRPCAEVEGDLIEKKDAPLERLYSGRIIGLVTTSRYIKRKITPVWVPGGTRCATRGSPTPPG